MRVSARTSRSSTKLMPEARCRSSKTLRRVTSRSSSEIGLALVGRSCALAMAGLTSFSSMARCRRRASRFCGFSVSTGRSMSCASRFLPARASCSASVTRARWRRSVSAWARPAAARWFAGSWFCTRAVERLGGLEAARLAQRLGLRQPLRADHVAHAEVLGAHVQVLRIGLGRLLQQRERLLGAAFAEVLARLVHGGRRRAGREGERARRRSGSGSGLRSLAFLRWGGRTA